MVEFIQIIGLGIFLAVLAQVLLLVGESINSHAYAKKKSLFELEILRRRAEEQSLRVQQNKMRLAAGWSGTRKFAVTQRVEECGDICSFYLRPHDGKAIPSFEPGQYLTFELRLPDGSKCTRCYSLSDGSQHNDYYRVSIKRVAAPTATPEAPPGVASNYFHDFVQTGDLLDVKAPSGNFYLDLTRRRPIVLIGAGVGITPVLSMLNSITHYGLKNDVWFFYGVRNSDEHIMRDHLVALARENERLKLNICYSDPLEADEKNRDYDFDERVTADLLSRVLPNNNFEFFICGPPPMMESLTQDLRSWGVPDGHVHFEAFGPASVRTAIQDQSEQPTSTFEITFDRSGRTVQWDGGQTSILELAEQSKIAMDAGCRAGSCGTCITAVKSGRVDYLCSPSGQIDSGTCLPCVAIPTSDVVLDA